MIWQARGGAGGRAAHGAAAGERGGARTACHDGTGGGSLRQGKDPGDGGHTEVTAVVNQPVISVCGVGKVKDGCLISTGGARPGMDILVTKWIGIEGTSIIAKEKETELKTKFSVPFVEKAKALDAYISVQSEAAVAVKSGVGAMHDVTEGGIFGALWGMAEASGVGLGNRFEKIPVRQETIEVCEFFGINPYQLISSGCMLMAAEGWQSAGKRTGEGRNPCHDYRKGNRGERPRPFERGGAQIFGASKADELYKAI